MAKRKITVALAGCPNCGKTTVFNALTGQRQHVGNYPGVTVEKKVGRAFVDDVEVEIVDLPGTYSLAPYTTEEVVARDFLLDQTPDVVINVVDSSNLERNLYLPVQLLELGVPMVLAFNMSDVASSQGQRIDRQHLSKLLGVPIVRTVGTRGRGMDKLLAKAVEVAEDSQAVARQRHVTYGHEIEPHVEQLTEAVRRICHHGSHVGHERWFAIKLLEHDDPTRRRLAAECDDADSLFAEADRLRRHIERVCGDLAEIALADHRYGFVSGACAEAVRQQQGRRDWSEHIDAVITHPLLGLPIFGVLMYLVFQLTFTAGQPLVDLLDWVIHDQLAGAVAQFWARDADSLLRSLLVDGIIGGVGAVLMFVPLIGLLFLAIAILEDTGYMARAAFVTDRLMHRIGLHGKSFVPLVIGFGCSVPAILATRTLETRRDRLVTMLIAPLMSCSARLPIYMLIIPAFFPLAWQTPILWSIYVVGILLAIGSARLLRSTILRGESAPFVMELPPYRMPTPRGLAIHTWERTREYIKKAGTIIFALSVLLWVINTFPQGDGEQLDAALAAERQQTLAAVEQLQRRAADGDGTAPPLAAALEADWQRQEALAAAWPDTPEAAEARSKYRQRRQELLAGPGGAQLATFLAAAEAIAAAEQTYQQALAEQDDPPAEARNRAHARRAEALADIQAKYPPVYPQALRYQQEILPAYRQDVRQLENRYQARWARQSYAGRLGTGLEPVLRPLGFDWRVGVALVGAVGAKEVFVSQMGIVFALGEGTDEGSDDLRRKLRRNYTALQAFCIMLFCLISAPCVATIAATAKESQSLAWAAFQLVGLTLLAYAVTLVVYQGGQLAIAMAA